jgi:hypothetical protein
VIARPLKVSLPSLSTPISTLPLNSFLPAVCTFGTVMFSVRLALNRIVTKANSTSITSTSMSGTSGSSGRR